jgi:hypothetical protein
MMAHFNAERIALRAARRAKAAAALFVQWDCGCVGFATNDPENAIVVEFCDFDGDGVNLVMGIRDQRHAAPGVPILPERACALLDKIATYIGAGCRYTEIRALLGIEGTL